MPKWRIVLLSAVLTWPGIAAAQEEAVREAPVEDAAIEEEAEATQLAPEELEQPVAPAAFVTQPMTEYNLDGWQESGD